MLDTTASELLFGASRLWWDSHPVTSDLSHVTQPRSLFETTASGFDLATAASMPGISGKVTAPEWFKGTIFVGLFTTPIPQGPPVSGTVIAQPGHYHVPRVPDGIYYLLAAGLAWSKDFREHFLYETTLRGGASPCLICDGNVEGSTDLSLRPPEPFDPPILMALPLLLNRINQGLIAH